VVKSSAISTGLLRAFLPLHVRPINLVVFQGPLVPEGTWIPHLEEGFTLRCFQRLAVPCLATLRCRWRDNRYTLGTCHRVLSY
jgi:hypothetical protein